MKYISDFIESKYNKYFDIQHNKDIVLNIILSSFYSLYNFINNDITIIQQLIYYDIEDYLLEYNYDYLYYNYVDSKYIQLLINIEQDQVIKFINKINKLVIKIFYKFIIPKRSYKTSHIISKNNQEHINKIKKQINYLKSIKQPEQRTQEWYDYRNSVLTASNIYKIFQSESSQSQLIIEKCKQDHNQSNHQVNIYSPLHWGQKYEPVSTMYYEWINNTKVDEFGCIPHIEYSFLGASPDGIVCDISSNLYGRMLEIKNVVSREITGIPKMEYWIQMQLQMEVCNLNECDFLETKFIEYNSFEEYENDISCTKLKGIICQFIKNNVPYYCYCPIDLSFQEREDWKDYILEINSDIEFIQFIYWRLEYVSCVLVLRNKLWFASVLPLINSFWNIVLDERKTGNYKNRIENENIKKRQRVKSTPPHEFANMGCLL